ncbi:hypothetical protein BK659_22980 [Pseudomonas brassicacearum]|uniref:DUF4435 domain-containing protein n=1 Tax=Pseudomonas brassicacearum TaxID=930166 RepID=A0A423GYC0_9PSED|nr:hypothetical protein [Pseudomonas brassicacearum]RON03374.1 hypothetical protein BK659_22980 [Pseudomonas brassicacearum]
MDNLPRRSIDDLIFMYELEPSLQDVYVEGVFDKDILTACFEHAGDKSRIVYTVDSVDIPFSVLKKYGLTEGNKQRIIALAREFEVLDGNSCKFLVDRDLDHWFEALYASQQLVWTRHCALELYFFTEDFLKRFLINASRSKIGEWSIFINGFCRALIHMYAFRLADRELDLKLEWVELDKDLKLSNGLVVFNRDSFLNRVLNKNNMMRHKNAFNLSALVWFEKCLEDDRRLAMRGHDFVSLLAFVIKNGKGVTALGSSEAIERTFVLLATRELEIYSDLAI